MWRSQVAHGGDAPMNISFVARVEGPVDVAALARSVQAVAQRHDALRAAFEPRADGLWQVPTDTLVELEVIATPGGMDDARRVALQVQLQPFDVSRAPLARIVLLRCSPAEGLLVLTAHHLVMDAVSMTVAMGEVAVAYEAHLDGRRPELGPPPTPYADHLGWQPRWINGRSWQPHLDHWSARFAGHRAGALPKDRPDTPDRSLRVGRPSPSTPPLRTPSASAAVRRAGRCSPSCSGPRRSCCRS